MKTLEKLQEHLNTSKEMIVGYEYKKPAPILKCMDGTTMSVQASKNHYCKPRNDVGPYTHVEIWRVSCVVTEFPYDPEEPSAYVPIEDVVQLINNHGGICS